MYNRSRYGRNHWYMAFFWTFIGFVLGQLTPRISFSLDERAQLAPSFTNTHQTTHTKQETVIHDSL